ncbi:hypothetical protein MPER_03895 [Moniliophthora perniciosa FA553]|nr:hypothetical protein MPER_03895 [Moniliophthora perniciosa FA553]
MSVFMRPKVVKRFSHKFEFLYNVVMLLASSLSETLLLEPRWIAEALDAGFVRLVFKGQPFYEFKSTALDGLDVEEDLALAHWLTASMDQIFPVPGVSISLETVYQVDETG